MAERFGGKYSPDGSRSTPSGTTDPAPANPFHGKRRTRVGGRANLLFFIPLPLAFRAFFGSPTELALNLAACGVLLLAAWLTREGLFAQDAYDARKVARRPALPRKMIASVLTGAGLGLAGLATPDGLSAPIIYAVLGVVLHGFAFGPDPLRDKGMEGIDSFQSDRVARAVGEAENYLAGMSDAIKRAGDRKMTGRVERFQTVARQMFRTIEEDPRDLTSARKFMTVYLMGARDATVKFADLYARNRDAKARSDYEALLDDLESHINAQTKAMLLDDRSDLDIEIEVLRERLQRDGVRAR
ncbi:5-bromo-4-chloroindolyl phosphate hydrolysis family protein [Pseudogemmobacter sp. W21_MBD1_M6]|uniref:5-bromo-4-chloroindolyl phosphate hydrolysis family protein n=1 Tax=Pseudogemmobacter sp. W21_MBD1_M6 TaxID=3240271 RepID=UPI003F99061A